ncbi:hypothetical protein [Sorangium sp. So ce1151]|uniref:hypothetical protein n=1 Tax=Sorangium sp. So ce1151 TaxID=3133332 RepID=UPI003F628A03
MTIQTPPRTLIPADLCVVALDTNVLRELCYGEPGWVTTFAQMSRDGYAFCLADAALAEVTNQFERGSITGEQLAKVIHQAESFIYADLPILPGKRDLAGMVGCLPPLGRFASFGRTALELWLSVSKLLGSGRLSTLVLRTTDRLGIPRTREFDWDPVEAQAYSKATWALLKASRSASDLQAGITYTVREHRFRVAAPPTAAATALASEREDWRTHFDQMGFLPKGAIVANDKDLIAKMAAEVDRGVHCTPRLSVRLDLPIKHLYRQHHLHNRAKAPYNPQSKKKENDGIDFDLYYVFILPALLVSIEGGFFNALKEIDSYQTSWLWKPEELAKAWEEGLRPAPNWPSSV